MPVVWNLKKWLAAEHNIYRPTELQQLLAEKAGVQLSLQAVSTLLNSTPGALRLKTIQALCNALNCSLSDFCEVSPDYVSKPTIRRVSAPTYQYDAQANAAEHQPANAAPAGDEAQRKPDVDPAIREIILRILEEQGLIPRSRTNISQHQPAQRHLLGILIPTWAWPYIPDLTGGIVEVVKEKAYDHNLVLYSFNEEDLTWDDGEAIDRFLGTQLAAGILAIFPGRASEHLTQLYQQGFPVVIIDDQREQSVPWVGADNITGAYMAVHHLIQLGHRRIAHIKAPSAEYLVSHDRYLGYCRALLEAGITPDPALVLEGDFLPHSGRVCASKWFELPLEKRPTAIFAASDQMAYGVLVAADEYGLSVPRDIALVGFDDDAPSAHTHPPLTTVRQPYYEMGQQAINLLLSMLGTSSASASRSEAASGEHEKAAPVRIQLPTRLVVRASCGADYQISVSTSSDRAPL